MKSLLIILFICNTILLQAQQKTFVKTNVFGFVTRNYSLELERTLNKRFTVGVNVRYMPNGHIPQLNTILKYIDPTDQETKNAISNALIGGNAFTPELRYYIGKKGYGKGFYLGGYFRSNNVKVDFFPFEVDNGSGTTRQIKTAGTIKTSGPGLLLGVQFNLGKNVVLDWQMIGAQYTSTTASISATPTPGLTTAEQNDINSALQDLAFGPFNLTKSVSANQVYAELRGKAPMVRSALSLGFKF
jgi:hypothetical protein